MVAAVRDIDKGWRQIKLNMEQLKGRHVKVGITADSGSVDGTTVIDYATYNEFGTRSIPARPFMATTADRYRDQTVKVAEAMIGQVLDQRYTVDTMLARLGAWYQAKVQQTIRDAKEWAVPNDPKTIAMKGSSSPLIDTGRLVQSVRYEVE
jgi:phage gpG-like protein